MRKLLYDNIPDELKVCNQWVCWRAIEKKDGKTDKIPVNANTGGNASVRDPETWGTFDNALAYYEKQKDNGIAGIGFVFTKDDPYAGIDLDDCRNPETNNFTDQASRILKAFTTYSEISPSNTGVKFICRAKLPGKGKAKNGIEIYDEGRFFTLTGGKLGSIDGKKLDSTINERQNQITELYNWVAGGKQKADGQNPPGWQDKLIKGVAQGSRHQTALRLAGRWAGKGHSDSEIVHFIIAWNESNVPPKSELSHSGSKEIQDIINYVRGKNSQNQKPVARGVSLNELKDQFSTEISWLWRSHYPSGLPCMVNGREGSGKTTICMVSAREILEQYQKGSILWLATEGAVQDTVNKMETLGLTSERFLIAQKADGSFKFDFIRHGDLKELDTILELLDPPVLAVFIDSIRGMSSLDDNDAKNGHVMHKINAIVCDKYKATLIYVDHWGKGKKDNLLDKAVGTTAKTAAVRLVLSVIENSKYTRVIKPAKSNLLPGIPNLRSVQKGTNIFIEQPLDESDETLTNKLESFLVNLLAGGEEMSAAQIYRLTEAEGYTEPLVKSVKHKLNIKSKKVSGEWVWVW